MRRLPAAAIATLASAFVLGGVDATVATSALPIDALSPSVPQGQVLTMSRTTATMRWNAAVDNIGVVGYRLYRNGAVVGTTKSLFFVYRDLRCGTTYTFALEAFDLAGNASNRAEATGTRTTLACPPPPRPRPEPVPPAAPAPTRPTGSTVANLWVDPDGGSCVRRAAPGRWVDGQSCSWNAAYRRARSGDLILVRGGSYGDVQIGPDRGDVRSVTFRTARGERAVVRDFENGHVLGRNGASNVSFVGPVTARTFRSDRASNVVVDRWRVDCGGCVGVQTFHIEDANNVVVRNSDIGDNTDNSLVWISGSNLRFENNRIHDAGLRPGSGAHTECMYVWRVTNLTLRRNHFFHCSVMDVFITGGDVARGGLIENNVFERPWEHTGRISSSAYAFHFRDGGSPSPDPDNWLFRHNTFVGPLSISSSENPGTSLRLIGNVFLSSAPCSQTRAFFAYNAFVSSGCGTNRVVRPLTSYLSGFANTGDPGNYSLRPTSVLRDRGSAADAPARDRTGRLRTGRPDLGAYEFTS